MLKSLMYYKGKKDQFIGQPVYYVSFQGGVQEAVLEKVINKQCIVRPGGYRNMASVYPSKDDAVTVLFLTEAGTDLESLVG